MNKVVTRFAPSPTGFLTIAGIRTALYNYLFARKHNGEFHLRFEDTDKTREVSNAKPYIVDTFNWLGFDIDGKIITQSENLHAYKQYAFMLVEKGFAYFAFDTKEELTTLRGTDPLKPISYSAYTRERMKNSLTVSKDEVDAIISFGAPYVIRFKTEKNKEVKFKDLIRGDVSFNTNNLDDKVLFKSDGFPTYHLANVVDDSRLAVTHVIRGNEWLSSTPLHIMLYEALGLPVPIFAHLPLVLDENGKKISKRNHKKYDYPIFPLAGKYTDADGTEYDITTGLKEAGYLPEAVLNALSLVGWTPKGDTDILSVDEMIEKFELTDCHNADAKFSIAKLKFLNKEYLKKKPVDYLYSFINNKIPNVWKHVYADDKIKLICDIALERSTFSSELYDSVDYFFGDVDYTSVKIKNVNEFVSFADYFIGLISGNVELTSKEQVAALVDLSCISVNINKGKILPDLRNALCGGKSGAELTTTMYILGVLETRNRIQNYHAHISANSKVNA